VTIPFPAQPWGLVGIEGRMAFILDALDQPAVGGVVLTGPAGVGKTATAMATADRARALGHVTERVIATSAPAHPFGALAPLTSQLKAHNPEEMTAEVVQAVHRRTGSTGRLLVHVDDAPLLDAASATALSELIRRGLVFVVATARDGAPLPPVLDGLVVEGALVRCPVAPLDRAQLEQAVTGALGGPVSAATVDRLWVSSQGVPLHARELVWLNLREGLLVDKPGGWEFVGDPLAPPDLIDLVSSRFQLLDGSDRRVFEALAIAERMSLGAASELAGVDLLASLEAAGLVMVTDEGGEPVVRLGHPLFGEVVRSSLGGLQQRSAAARALTAMESVDPGAALPAAILRLEHDLPLEPDQALTAARRALELVDPAVAERLLRAAGCDSYDARFALGTALIAQRQTAAADQALSEAFALASTDEERARVISRRGNNLGTGAGLFEASIAVLEEGLASIEDPHWRSFVAADLAYARSWIGDAGTSSGAAPHEPSTDGPKPDAVRANECLVGAVVAVMAGDLTAADRFVTEGLPLTPAIREDVPTARELLTLSRFLGLAFGGRSADASALVEVELERAHDRSEAAPGTWLAVRSVQRYLDGDLDRAIHDALDAADRLDHADISGLRPVAQAVRAAALAQQGDITGSLEAAEQTDAAWLDETKVRLLLAQAAAWREAISTSTRSAARALAVAGQEALDANHVPLGAMTAHGAVRLGHHRSALPVLRTAADRWEGPLAGALLRHAEALEAEDPDALLAIAFELPELGFTLAGAEAAAQAARRYEATGDPATAQRAEFVAASIAARRPGVQTPSLGNPRGLTPREHDIAARAGAGDRSRDIAADLGISVRTVDNHLASIYRKLGVSNRGEMQTQLARTDPAPPSPPAN